MKRANSLQKQTKLYISAACGGNAHGVCRPGRDTAVRRKSFLPYFLYFTKSKKKKPPQGGGEAAERQKDLIGLVRSRCFGALIRGLQNLESPFGKVLILFQRSRHCGELIRGLQNLESCLNRI